jgi:hypothetical protein
MRDRLNPIIERFRFAHHHVAMLFAAGLSVQEISHRTGFTQRRLNLLSNDPTFRGLVEHYRKAPVQKLKIPDDENFDEAVSDEVVSLAREFRDPNSERRSGLQTIIDVDFAMALDRALERGLHLIKKEESDG